MAAIMVKSLPSHISSLSDDQLYGKLRSYIPHVGPVLPSTRAVYERKLYALETGQDVEAVSNFAPADDDEDEGESDDEEDDVPQPFRKHPPPQPRYRSTVTYKPEPPIQRSEIGATYARRPLHSGIGDYPLYRAPAKGRTRASPVKRERTTQPAPTGRRWLVWLAVFIGAVLMLTVYTAIRNMEHNPESSIPDKIDMQED